MAVDRPSQGKKSVALSIYIMDRVAQGASFQQIAEEQHLSVATISRRYRKEAKLQLANMPNLVAEIKLLQTQKLTYIEDQALKSWQKSADVDEKGNPTKEGDPKYLDTAMKSMAAVRKIWDADKPLEPGALVEMLPSTQTEGNRVGNVNQIEEVLMILQEIGELPEGIDTEKVGEMLLPVEHDPEPEELSDEIT